MDTFFKLVKRTVGLEELHVIGVACIYIASKYEDVKFINMESLYSKISYKKLPIKYIKKVEREILETLGYRLAIPTVLDFLYEKIKDQNDEFVKSAYLIADLSMLNYDLAMVKSSCLADAICIVTKQVIFKHEQLIFNNEILHVLYSLKSFITDFCKNSNGLISVLTRHSAQIASSPSNLFEFNW